MLPDSIVDQGRRLDEQSRARTLDLEKSVESLSREVSDYHRLLFRGPMPILIYRADSLLIETANERALDLFGYERQQLEGTPVLSILGHATGDDLAPLRNALCQEVTGLGPFTCRAHDGRELVLRLSSFKLHLQDSDSWLALIHDESACHTAEEALRASEERYRDVFENANDVIYLQDLNGRLLSLNHAAESLTGYSRVELEGRHFGEILPPEAREEMMDSIRAHLGGSPAQRYELPIVPKSGPQRILEVSTRIIYRRGHPVAVQGIGRDITDSKQARQRLLETATELRLKNEELRTALRVAQEATQLKEQFLANTSHELRTPLNGIMGMINLLKDTELTGDQREYVDAVSQCSDDLLIIINDLLDMSQIEAGRFTILDESFELEDSVRSVIKLLTVRAASKGLSLTYSIGPKLPIKMFGDPVRFRQVLMNLIANAVKFTPSGGVRAEFVLSSDGCFVRGTVRDSGIGVEPSLQEKIFEPFFQADGTMRRRFGGTGLGLAICKQLVELMGGRIGTCNNTPEPGATFWFELPLRTAPVTVASG